MRTKIFSWNPQRGFGFINMDGKRFFVHVNAITPRQERGADLNGVEIIVQKIEENDKGFSIVSAMTVAEFERQEAEKKKAAEELAADKKRLLEILPKLQEKIKEKLPLYGSIFLEGAVLRETTTKVDLVSFDTVDGAIVDFTQTLLVCVGKATETATFSWRSEGWKGVSLNSNTAMYKPVKETEKLSVEMSIPFKGFIKAEFPATASAPRIEGKAVVQEITSNTPVGIVTKKISLYSNPLYGDEHPEDQWGDYDISPLIAEIDTKVLTEAGIIGDKLPIVKFEVENFKVEHDTTYEYESNDGMGTRIGGHRWTTYHGGLSLELEHPFLVREGYISISFRLEMNQRLDHSAVENYVHDRIQTSIKNKCLKGYNTQEFGEKLFSQIMSQIPVFSKEEDLWIIDEEKLPFYQLAGIPHGQAVISVDLESSTLDRVVSKAVIVTQRVTAEKLKLPGESLAEAVVWWKNPPCEVIPLAEQAEQLLAKLREVVASKTFSCFPMEIRDKIERQLNSNSNVQPFDKANPEYVREWCYYSKRAIDALRNAEPEALVLAEKEKGGEIVTGFTAWHRTGGATNNGDGWVIRPDGSLREQDSDDVRRHKSDGTYRWEIVQPDELAISWSKANTAAEHEFVIHKLPVNGCTSEQLATVARLEQEIDKRFKGLVGISGKSSPGIGKGWNLGGKIKEATKEGKKEGKDLASELAGFNKTFGR